MARSISDEELQLKRKARRRLIGAIALVAVTVVVLPMVLDDKPMPVSNDIAINIPAKDGGEPAPTNVPATRPTASNAAAPAPVPAPVQPSAVPAPPQPLAAAPAPAPAVDKAKEAPRVEAPAKPQPEAKHAPDVRHVAEAKAAAEKSAKVDTQAKPDKAAPKAESTAKPGPFVVRIGAYANADNARKLQAKLKAAGIKSYLEKTPGGDKTRLRAGPYATESEAGKARDKIRTLKLVEVGMDVVRKE